MRYVSQHKRLALYTNTVNATTGVTDTKLKYQFEDGVLDLGAGNTISTTDLAILYPSASTAIAKCGQGKLFFEAPITTIEGGAGTAVPDGGLYTVLSGKVLYGGVVYSAGAEINVLSNAKTLVAVVAPGSTATPSAQVAFYPRPPYAPLDVNQFQTERFKSQYLINGNELPATWQYGDATYNPNFGGLSGLTLATLPG